MTTRRDYAHALEIEKKHLTTYEWIKDFLKKKRVFPKERDFLLHLAEDNFRSDKDYYDTKKTP